MKRNETSCTASLMDKFHVRLRYPPVVRQHPAIRMARWHAAPSGTWQPSVAPPQYRRRRLSA